MTTEWMRGGIRQLEWMVGRCDSWDGQEEEYNNRGGKRGWPGQQGKGEVSAAAGYVWEMGSE